MDSNKNDKMRLKIEEGWDNYRVFGSLYNSRIKERNKEGVEENMMDVYQYLMPDVTHS